MDANDRVPPTLWLDDDTGAIKSLLGIEFFNLAKLPWLLAMWLRKLRFGGTWIEPEPVVKRLEADVAKWRGI